MTRNDLPTLSSRIVSNLLERNLRYGVATRPQDCFGRGIPVELLHQSTHTRPADCVPFGHNSQRHSRTTIFDNLLPLDVQPCSADLPTFELGPSIPTRTISTIGELSSLAIALMITMIALPSGPSVSMASRWLRNWMPNPFSSSSTCNSAWLTSPDGRTARRPRHRICVAVHLPSACPAQDGERSSRLPRDPCRSRQCEAQAGRRIGADRAIEFRGADPAVLMRM
jgi:hypothetical protein